MQSSKISLEQRKVNVQRLLQENLGIHAALNDIIFIDRGYNNYLYSVTVAESATKPHNGQPGTVPFLANATTPQSLVVRLLKTELGAIPERVQNEVAALALVRQPLASVTRVPKVYGWSEGRGPGEIPYIIMDLLPGIPLDTIWPLLDLPARLPILSQIRDVIMAMRSIPIPVPCTSSNCAFGGLGFSASGSITTAIHPDSAGGPFKSAEEQWLWMLSNKLRAADGNTYLKGWKGSDQPDDLRGRLDSFIQSGEGFRTVLSQIAADPIFVHGDFNCRNFLVSPETNRITGLLDFEFARIGTFPEEFMDGLEDFRKHDCVQPAPEGVALHLLESNGWPCLISESASLGCQTAKAWKELVQLPLQGYEGTAQTYDFIDKVCPWYFCQEPWCNTHDMPSERGVAESSLSAALAAWGF
ncbi:kinase-like domain-containing protein [Mycena alexandri]|uniref:Kinase-like domain-containing protein n=1 Tax=Mycena alexandri TaxID=1745969 RepID=A0AAD6TBS1_9AGAR|nr:kinase-like domain-containing protein [Mycena alexandri]